MRSLNFLPTHFYRSLTSLLATSKWSVYTQVILRDNVWSKLEDVQLTDHEWKMRVTAERGYRWREKQASNQSTW